MDAPSNAPASRADRLASTGRTNLRVARTSVGVAFGLVVLKAGAVVVTGSLGILATVVDSLLDVFASTVNYLAVRFAARPADAGHRYGHGKAESLAGMVQGTIIAGSGLYVFVEGIRRLATGETAVAATGVGIAVMAVSVVASVWIGRLLLSTARETGSVALEADSTHYTSDVWLNGGVLLALVLIALTGWSWIDGAIACGAALFVIAAASGVLKSSVDQLMDRALPEEEQLRILRAVSEAVPEARDIHDFRTRRAGPTWFVDLHAAFPRHLSFVEAHRLSEKVRLAIEEAMGDRHVEVHVHADPHPMKPEDLG